MSLRRKGQICSTVGAVADAIHRAPSKINFHVSYPSLVLNCLNSQPKQETVLSFSVPSNSTVRDHLKNPLPPTIIMNLQDLPTYLNIPNVVLILASLYVFRYILHLLISDCDLHTYSSSPNPSHYHGKVAWITGATSGIGLALATRLSREGALLILTSRREAVLNEVADNLPCPRASVHILPLDLTNIPAVEAAAERISDIFGRLDFVFNNAGVTSRASAADLDVVHVRQIFELDFFAPVALARAVLPALRENPGGCGTVVNISSIAALVPTPLRSSYSAAKSALVSYFECLRLEEKDVRVVNIYPGSCRTPISMNAIVTGGKPYGRMDENIANGLLPSRVAECTLAAISAGRPWAWIAGPKELTAVRISQAFPSLWAFISAKLVADTDRSNSENAPAEEAESLAS